MCLSVSIRQLKLQAVCAFRFMCRHIVVRRNMCSISEGTWVRKFFRTGKLTFQVTINQGHWYGFHSVGHKMSSGLTTLWIMTGPFLLSILVFVLVFFVSLFFRSVRQTKLDIRQLLGARKYSYRIVSYRIVYDFLLIFCCNDVCIVYRFRDIISYFPKYKEVTWPWIHPFGGNSWCML